jgi:hypothetical protein
VRLARWSQQKCDASLGRQGPATTRTCRPAARDKSGSPACYQNLCPAMTLASFVACLCESLKYTGMVTTALFVVRPKKASAISIIFVKIMADISSGENCFSSPLCLTMIMGLSLRPGTTLKGQSFMSFYIEGSENLQPMSRLASNTVFCGFIATWFIASSFLFLFFFLFKRRRFWGIF